MNDYAAIKDVQKRLTGTLKNIQTLAPLVGYAKQVREYDSDRRKNLLARFMLPYLKAGHSAASAEVEGRADPAYQIELEELATQRETAEKSISEWDAAMCRYEGARSILSMEKQLAGL